MSSAATDRPRASAGFRRRSDGAAAVESRQSSATRRPCMAPGRPVRAGGGVVQGRSTHSAGSLGHTSSRLWENSALAECLNALSRFRISAEDFPLGRQKVRNAREKDAQRPASRHLAKTCAACPPSRNSARKRCLGPLRQFIDLRFVELRQRLYRF